MKNEIDIFSIDDFSHAHRADRDANAELMNIVFWGATFGNFLKLFIERFSNKTPDFDAERFSDIGTVHGINPDSWSGLVQRYHTQFINDNKGLTGLPVCLIMPRSKRDFLYLKKAQWYRSWDRKWSPDMLWQKAIGELPDKIKYAIDEIIDLYQIKEKAHFSWVPKYIIRDWYKLGFLRPFEESYDHQWYSAFRSHPFWQEQNVMELPLETFFDWPTFIKNIRSLDHHFGLALDYDQQDQMQDLFDRHFEKDLVRQEAILANDVIEKDTDADLRNLDVATEAFIYAELEKRNPDIQMPLTNRFFRDTEEIRQFIDHYPNWYRKKNPNLPQK